MEINDNNALEPTARVIFLKLQGASAPRLNANVGPTRVIRFRLNRR
jgi:hypothetical protein